MQNYLRDYRQKTNINSGGRGNNPDDGTKILLKIIRPVFENSESNLSLSSFVASCAIPRFSIGTTSITLIRQSLKGFIRFPRTWGTNRRSRPLNFIPIESVEEYYDYLPVEIEDKVIIPADSSNLHYHNNIPSVQREVTSYAPSREQKNEMSEIVAQRSFDNNILKVSKDTSDSYLRPSSHQLPGLQKPLPYRQATYNNDSNNNRQQKSIETKESPKKIRGDAQRSVSPKGMNKSVQLPIEERKYLKKTYRADFSPEEKTPDQLKAKSSIRDHSPVVVKPLRLASKKSAPAEKQNQIKAVSEFTQEGKSTVAENSMQSKQLSSIETDSFAPFRSKGSVNRYTGGAESPLNGIIDRPATHRVEKKKKKEKEEQEKNSKNSYIGSRVNDKSSPAIYNKDFPKDSIVHPAVLQPTKQIDLDKINHPMKSFQTIAPEKKRPKNKDNTYTNNFASFGALDIVKPSYPLGLSSIAESLNLLDYRQTALQPDYPILKKAKNKPQSPFDSLIKVSDSNNDYHRNYANSNSKFGIINVDRLDISVVDDDTRAASAPYSTNVPMEIAESTNSLDHSDDEENMGTVESLNKSYLWKYKVRF